ncbi:efflux transporter outer membrane subunit [Alkalicaulis satelles]|uniref:Efflux transporter outer membrane subunit n=1 Tax=Alkalicaulis satelles TaxID=2609175 RepID=A0A5M6ZN02_9PROT|nr:efflux transporter outer membrane subunit [Alkalicaulis satelles]KAA5804964.1 efflux transporter outer membrane subunit [Alkalicaulis satelles]
MIRCTTPLLAALTVTACASQPMGAAALPDGAPGRFAALPETVTAAPQDWIAAFEDPVLSALVDEAMQANPSLSAARAGVIAARAAARGAGGARLPSLDGRIGVTDQDAPAQSGTSYSLGLEASWTADVWGRLSDQARASALTAEAVHADWRGARLSVAAGVAQAWYGLIEAREQRDLALADVETRTRQTDIVERRFQRGVARSSDLRTARSALASSEAVLALRERAVDTAARALEIQLGRYPANALAIDGGLPALGAVGDPGSPEALLQRRPDIVAAEARMQAAGFSADAARKALYPGLTLRAELRDTGASPGDIFDAQNLTRIVSASVLAPVFRGGQLRAERDRQAALAEQASARLVETVLTALREVENALSADGRLARRVEALAAASAEADAALELVERQYASGVATIFELIDAQTRATQAQGQLITARRERVDNRIALYLATAGGFAAQGGQAGEL